MQLKQHALSSEIAELLEKRRTQDASGMVLRFRKEHKMAITPAYAHAGDSGMDVCTVEHTVLKPGEYVIIDTGLSFEIPEGTEIQVRLRSGTMRRYPVVMPNAPGTIDSGYRGTVHVPVMNVSSSTVEIPAGVSIAQLVLCPVIRAQLVETETEFAETSRGGGGFGHTGPGGGSNSMPAEAVSDSGGVLP